MAIMNRFLKLMKADIHGVMDQLEDQGLLLKQYLRDMQEDLDRKETKLAQLISSREKAKTEHEKYTRESAQLEQDLAVALEREKDDIARMLIKKLKPLAYHQDELDRHIKTLDQQIDHFRECLDEQHRQYEQFQLKTTEYFRKLEREQWEKSMPTFVPSAVFREPSDQEVELELLKRKEARKGGESI
jgi:phage shock protein A